jgi:hypothetical protein
VHVINMGKYGTSMAALVVRYARDQRPPHAGWTAAAVLVCLAASVYSYAWDLRMDWGLVQAGATHPGLRNVLMLREPRCAPACVCACMLACAGFSISLLTTLPPLIFFLNHAACTMRPWCSTRRCG